MTKIDSFREARRRPELDSDTPDWVALADTSNWFRLDHVFEELRRLGEHAVTYYLDIYQGASRSEARASALSHALHHARATEPAFQLGLAALTDPSRLVRYRACALLAYALREEAIPALRQIAVDHPDPLTREDAAAAMTAISEQNHHLFMDRERSGQVHWIVGQDELACL